MKTNMECKKCGYTWYQRGWLDTNCPNCGSTKTITIKQK